MAKEKNKAAGKADKADKANKANKADKADKADKLVKDTKAEGKKAAKSKKAAKAPKAEILVRNSPVHGRGVFAAGPIADGARIIEYKGKRITWKQAMARHPHDPENPNHTFFFGLEDGKVIDGGDEGNDARWINHACEPNCEAREKRDRKGRLRVHIHALRAIAAGEELFYDYGLVIEGRQTKKLKQEYACRCGSPQCRGTMLAPKTR